MNAPNPSAAEPSFGLGGAPAEAPPAEGLPTESDQNVTPSIGAAASAPFLPDTFNGDPAFEGFESLDSVLSEFKTLKTLEKTRQDQGLVAVPTEESSDDERNAFYNKLGRPETPAEYSMATPENFPESLEISDERMAKFAQTAHSLGLTQQQVDGIYALHNQFTVEEYAKIQQNEDQVLGSNLQILENMWGKESSVEFKQKHAQAERAFNFVADPELTRMFQQNRVLATHPSVMEVLSRIGGHLTEDQVPSIAGTTSRADFSADSTLEGIESKIAAFPFKEMMDKIHTREGKAEYEEWTNINAQRRQLLNQKLGIV